MMGQTMSLSKFRILVDPAAKQANMKLASLNYAHAEDKFPLNVCCSFVSSLFYQRLH